MSDLDRLHAIIDALPPQQVHALLTLLAPPESISDEEFARRLAMAPEEEVDEGTTARIFAAEADRGESISHGELKQRIFFSLDQPGNVVVTDVDNRGQAY